MKTVLNPYTAKLQLVENAFEVVSALPSNPIDGQTLILEITGRKMHMVYEENIWKNLHALRDTLFFTDIVNGTDSPEFGFGTTTNAFATRQYAIDQIAGRNFGNVSISDAGGSNSEDLTFKGKDFAGDFGTTLNGSLTEEEEVSSATISAGTGTTQGTVTKVGAFTGDSYTNKWVYLVTDAVYRLIDSHTDDILTLVGTAPSSTTQTVKIYSEGTQFANLTIGSAQTSITVSNCMADDGVLMNPFSELVFTNNITSKPSGNCIEMVGNCKLSLAECYIQPSASSGIVNSTASFVDVSRSKIFDGSVATIGLRNGGGDYLFRNGSIVDGFGTAGIRAENNGAINCFSGAGAGYPRIRNNGTGAYAFRGGQVVVTGNNVYSGNSTDENGVAASFGYVGA